VVVVLLVRWEYRAKFRVWIVQLFLASVTFSVLLETVMSPDAHKDGM
jgi:hypothetical protein